MLFPAPYGSPRSAGLLIRAARILVGYRLADLSERTGLSISQLSLIERGRRSLTPEVAARIAEALGGIPPGAEP